MFDPSAKLGQDPDPQETREWLDSLDAVLYHHGDGRARFLLEQLVGRATRYRNTLPGGLAGEYPGDLALEQRIENIIRWNAVMLVSNANRITPGLGGHLSTYASCATLFEVAFNHFLQARTEHSSGDQVYFQPHASPGIYARAYLEGRLREERLRHFRREVSGKPGLSSYPHPWLMPRFWEFPTASMGLSPISAIYQARFNRYLTNRGIRDTDASRVWAFLGDGEMDEPEATGALSIAAREGLNNLIFVVNCNLQRLDGPVRGNGKIIEELAQLFDGAGWQVIKLVWGSGWDALLDADADGSLQQLLDVSCDGDWQRMTAQGQQALREIVGDVDDDTLAGLCPGGHDPLKVHEAYTAACASTDRPVVILAQTVKGWGLGQKIVGKNTTHMAKVLDIEQTRWLRDELDIPVPDRALANPPFYRPPADSPEMVYLHERRQTLGGYLPKRTVKPVKVKLPQRSVYTRFMHGSGDRGTSSTAAFAQLLAGLLKDPEIGRRVVPIIPDEARTFGMEALFATHGIYSPVGQRYEPPDHGTLLSYREAVDGQLLQEGICEAGAMSSFTAAGTSYATHGEPMIPFYIFYSIFGFQRTGDQIWAFGDQRGRGFLMGATAGRTTLSGEGLQHEDGQSHLLATMMPNVRAYDPAFAYELALIVQDGMRRMLRRGENVFYYITLYNEAYPMPPLPEGVREGVIEGLYLLNPASSAVGRRAQILASGPIVGQALRAQQLLEKYWGVLANVWSATSWQLLRREALEAERYNRLHPLRQPRIPRVTQLLSPHRGPVVAASDYLSAVPDQIARWVPGGLSTLGTDGFGRSDTRAALRRHFEVDAESIVITVLDALARQGKLDPRRVVRAMRRFGIAPDKPPAWNR